MVELELEPGRLCQDRCVRRLSRAVLSLRDGITDGLGRLGQPVSGGNPRARSAVVDEGEQVGVALAMVDDDSAVGEEQCRIGVG